MSECCLPRQTAEEDLSHPRGIDPDIIIACQSRLSGLGAKQSAVPVARKDGRTRIGGRTKLCEMQANLEERDPAKCNQRRRGCKQCEPLGEATARRPGKNLGAPPIELVHRAPAAAERPRSRSSDLSSSTVLPSVSQARPREP